MTVDLTLAKAQCRVTHSDEDALLEQYIASAKAWIERYTARLVAEDTVIDTFTEFGDYLVLSRGPFVSLTAVDYVDADGAEQELEGTRFRDGRIYPPTVGWPSYETFSTITVTYLAGYDVYELPEELVQAQLLLISHWYEQRSGVVVGVVSKELEYAIEALAGPFRLPTLR
jgi:uncharacterized phiE125 gp8 family phage protein